MCSPETIVYARALPNSDCGGGQNNSFYNLPIDPNSRIVEINTLDPQLVINDLSDSNKWKFNIDFLPYSALAAIASMVPYANDVAKPNPTLLGETIDRVDLTWEFSNDVTSQVLTSDDGSITHPTLDTEDESHSYTGLSITENTEFYLNGNDGKGLEGSTLQIIFKLLFGNYFYYGNSTSLLNQATSGLQAILGGMNKDIAVSLEKDLYATGEANKHFFFAYPKRFGLPDSIKKGEMTGGYMRLKNVAGTLKSELIGGDTESDISISNGLASEAYYVFMSQFDYQDDNDNLIEIK